MYVLSLILKIKIKNIMPLTRIIKKSDLLIAPNSIENPAVLLFTNEEYEVDTTIIAQDERSEAKYKIVIQFADKALKKGHYLYILSETTN